MTTKESKKDEREKTRVLSHHLIGKIDEDKLQEISTLVREADGQNFSYILLFLSSPGGSLNHALAIYDLIRSLRHPVFTVAVGAVNSAAIIIFLAGDRRYVLSNATLTIHSPSMEVNDDSFDATDAKIVTQRLNNGLARLVAIYAEHTKLKPKTLEALCRKTETLSAKQAISYGFAHKLVPAAKKLNLPRVSNPFKT